MLTWIFAVLVLFVLQTWLPVTLGLLGSKSLSASFVRFLGGRDKKLPTNKMSKRSARALKNMQEAIPVFLALGMISLIQGEEVAAASQRGAAIFFVARVLYIPAYLSGILGLRTTIWLIGWVGLILMAWPLFG